MNRVSYQLEIQDVTAHRIEVTLNFVPCQNIHLLSMPAWIPGSYMIRDFAKHLLTISAFDATGSLTLQQLDKQSWQLTCRQQPVTVIYQVYAYDLSVRAAYVDDELAVLNPAALCLGVSNLNSLPQQITLAKPQSAAAESWRVATALTPVDGTLELGFGAYQAADYASLVDSPLLAGVFNLQQFMVDGMPHYLVVTGNNLADFSRLATDLQQICQQQRNVFGGLPADLDQYWFLLWVTEQGYGGLEHKFSTLLLCNRYDLPAANSQQPDDNYQQLLGLCSHEYFHTWWVKRLMPAEFKPYQLAAEQYSKQLWVYEGFTSYFDDLALVQGGLISPDRYLLVLEKLISRVTRSPSDSLQSLEDSSFNAWTKFYKQDENAINAVVSYYAKGALLALCLEGAMRQQGSSLQSLCHYMYQHYLASGTDEHSVFDSLSALGFAELADSARDWVTQSKPLPIQHAASQLGLTLNFRPAIDHNDLSGSGDNSDSIAFPASLAAGVKVQQGLLTITQIIDGGAAHQAGLMVGDQLLALAGLKITEQSLPQLLRRAAAGTEQMLTIYRKDRLLTLQLPLQVAPAKIACLQFTDNDKASRWLQRNIATLPTVIADPTAPGTS
ncbi:Predicted metalloprotease, contains C-terminal PDZ domain [Arsukibacterium tuosuense]|uniref:Predicted metalloprotease, contains C-terminal PDZ domain n=1 Tax=Arsukibacterium tuosuense TaxID=1323745 RepID=A0A285I1R1_9GAMM|nr:PDZ domain-containing protein [Arsukibacterium tuosuense]SNY41894.1 Predicted metalloprotease, contains C-terminal PDZ domain [Arsukibacterium tuosuense]